LNRQAAEERQTKKSCFYAPRAEQRLGFVAKTGFAEALAALAARTR
jgi:hypothetical protein